MLEPMQQPTEARERFSDDRVNLLLVDDEPANLLALEAVLSDFGANLVKVRSGEEAVQHSLRDDFAAILLDVQMHGLDGFETARLIRSEERSKHTPVLFLTAHEYNRLSVEDAYSLGAVDYLFKPLVPVILRAKVAGFIELFRKARQVERQGERIRQMERREFERRLAEEGTLLKRSEARKTAIVEVALDCIIAMDHEGKIIEFNPAAEKTFGYSRDEVMGREMAELIVPPAFRAQHYKGLAHYLSTGEGPVLNRRLELPALRADGTEFLGELAIAPVSAGASPIFIAVPRDWRSPRSSPRPQVSRKRLPTFWKPPARASAGTLERCGNSITPPRSCIASSSGIGKESRLGNSRRLPDSGRFRRVSGCPVVSGLPVNLPGFPTSLRTRISPARPLPSRKGCTVPSPFLSCWARSFLVSSSSSAARSASRTPTCWK
jgi:PAS domain S-box-containing protein